MPARYTQKHSHVSHARSSDPDFYYKIIFFTLFGYHSNDIARVTKTPIQTVNRNFKSIRAKLAYNQNYLIELHNLFYHVDPFTGGYYSQWRQELRTLQPAKNTPMSKEQKDRTERLVDCLKNCRMGDSPKSFIQEYIEIEAYNSLNTSIDRPFEPLEKPYIMYMTILRNVDKYMDYMEKKKSCRACRLCKRDRQTYFTIFSESPYIYLDITYHLSRFQPKKLEDYNDHFYYAWINGCLRGIHHMQCNKTALKQLSFEEQLEYSNHLLISFVNLTYDAIAGKVLPSLPFPD